MKKESTNGLQSAIRNFLSIALLCSAVVFFSGCGDYLDFEVPMGDLNLGGGPFTGPGVVSSGPGYIYADSVVATPDDSLTLYGHFSPSEQHLQIVECGFLVYDNFGNTKITLWQNEAWHFEVTDTVVQAAARIAGIKGNVHAHMQAFYTIKNEYGVESMSQSNVVVIKEFVPSLIAVHDSVAQYDSNQVILWGHLETKEDCELTQVTVNWGYRWTALNAEIIKVPNQMKVGKILHVADTIDVTPNAFYEWSIIATAKFANDSTGTTPYVVNEFVTGN
jgi:hypothetical protein